MRRWYHRALVLAIGGLSGRCALAQESRPIPETIRVRPVDEAPRTLPRNILVLPEDIVADPSVLSLPKLDDSKPALQPAEFWLPALPPLAVPAAAPAIDVPLIEPPPIDRNRTLAIPVDSPKPPADPGLLPSLDVPAGGLPPLPSTPELPPPPRVSSDPQLGAHSTPAIIPVGSSTTPAPQLAPAVPTPPSNPAIIVPGTTVGQRKPFWDPTYDPMRDGDPSGSETVLALDRNPRSHWWFEADYLQWFMPRGHTPALLYGGLPSNASTPDNPVLGRTFSIVDAVGRETRTTPGLAFTLGTWFEPNYRWGLQVSVLTIFDRGDNRSYSSPGDLYLLQPYVNAVTGVPAFATLAGGGQAGAITINTRQSFTGQEVQLLHAFRDIPSGSSLTSINFLVGFRHLQFRDDLDVATQSVSADGNTYIGTEDHFQTWTDFYGAQVGVQANWQYGRFAADFTGKVSLGCATENSTISGATAAYSPSTGGVFAPGGFYALPSNIGTYQRQRVAFVPELGLKLSYQITPRIVANCGYNFIYLSSVIRAGDQIDTAINPNNTALGNGTGPAQPAFRWKGDDLWAQGITLGLTFQY